LIVPIVVAALAAMLGGAMPLLVYGMGPQPAEVELLLPAHGFGGSPARPIVALSLSERAQSGEPGGLVSLSRLQAPLAAPSAKDDTSMSGEEVAGSLSHAAPTHGSGAGASEPVAEPAAASDQDDGSVPAVTDDEEAQASTGEGAKMTLCHKPGSKEGGVTITVSEDAVPEHLAHGDTIGACVEN
jgi:hypothetical protein